MTAHNHRRITALSGETEPADRLKAALVVADCLERDCRDVLELLFEPDQLDEIRQYLREIAKESA